MGVRIFLLCWPRRMEKLEQVADRADRAGGGDLRSRTRLGLRVGEAEAVSQDYRERSSLQQSGAKSADGSTTSLRQVRTSRRSPQRPISQSPSTQAAAEAEACFLKAIEICPTDNRRSPLSCVP